MSDVRESAAPATANENRADPQGHFVWYELMTPDPVGAKAFYDAVVGWDIGEAAPDYGGYRMIGRSDGKFAGGVNPHDHYPGPTWISYVGVNDVDSAVASIEQGGGRLLKEAWDIPNVGRVAMVADPQGAPFYVMTPMPPARQENEPSDVFSPSEQQRVGWNELQTTDQDSARRFYGEQFGWRSDDFMPMGELGEYRFWDYQGVRLGAVFDPKNEGFAAKNRGESRWRYYIRVPSIAKAKEAAEQKGGAISMGPHQVPTGDWIIVGTDPQGAEFALVGGA